MKASIAYDRMTQVKLIARREMLLHRLDLWMISKGSRELWMMWQDYYHCLQEIKLRGDQLPLPLDSDD